MLERGVTERPFEELVDGQRAIAIGIGSVKPCLYFVPRVSLPNFLGLHREELFKVQLLVAIKVVLCKAGCIVQCADVQVPAELVLLALLVSVHFVICSCHGDARRRPCGATHSREVRLSPTPGRTLADSPREGDVSKQIILMFPRVELYARGVSIHVDVWLGDPHLPSMQSFGK